MLDVMTWADDMYPIVLSRFQDRLDKRGFQQIKKLIGFKPIGEGKGNAYSETGMGGYGLMAEYDGSNIPEQNQKRGFKTIYTPKEYVGKATVTYKDAKADQSGEATKAGNKMADSARMTIVRGFYNLFGNGFNAAYVFADGKPMFAIDHPQNSEAGAPVFSNLFTDVFSIAAITKMQTAAQRFKTYDGQDYDMDVNLVIVSPELEPKAKEFFGAEAKLLPESSENGANPVSDMKYVVMKGFSAKQWAAGDSELIKEYIKMVELTAPIVIPNKPDNPLIQEYVAYADFTFGCSDARCILGSNPG
jgi:hypothetical protein